MLPRLGCGLKGVSEDLHCHPKSAKECEETHDSELETAAHGQADPGVSNERDDRDRHQAQAKCITNRHKFRFSQASAEIRPSIF